MRHNPPETTIVRALLAAGDSFVSGNDLAGELGISRVAVWQHMEKLRDQGFGFEAVRARGYRLIEKPPALNEVLLAAYLPSGSEQFALDLYDEIDSTNDEASRQLAAGRAAPFAILSRRQTRGRGRFGRVWHSEANGNLYVSFGFRPHQSTAKMQTFTLWMGANVCELVNNFCRVSPSLKWPNDILFDGRKAGGILTEARIDADEIRELILGLGLNVNSAGDWPPEIAHRAISIAEHVHTPLDLNRFAAALIGRIQLAYQRFLDGSYLEVLRSLWERYDGLRGRPVNLVQGARHVAGIASGIDDEGSLLLRTEHGTVERFRAGEVTLGSP